MCNSPAGFITASTLNSPNAYIRPSPSSLSGIPMFTKRIIPCLDVTLNENGATVVKGVEFVNLRNAGDPVELAKRYNEQGADD